MKFFTQLQSIVKESAEANPLLEKISFHFSPDPRRESKVHKLGILNEDLEDRIYVETSYDLSREHTEIYLLQLRTFGFYLMILGVCLLIAFYMTRMISYPVSALIKDINRAASKDLDHSIAPVYLRELKTLRVSVVSLIASLKDKMKQVVLLSNKVIEAGDDERERIARDLHDSIGQNLISIKLQLDLLEKRKDRSLKEGLKQPRYLLALTIDELRDLYTGLYPSILSDFGLKNALEWYLSSFVKKGVSYDFQCPNSGFENHKLKVNLFRISQELVSNMQKHSGGNHFSIEISIKDYEVLYIYQDIGVGMKSGQKKTVTSGFGLENIRVRVNSLGGVLKSLSPKKQGYKVAIKIPLQLK